MKIKDGYNGKELQVRVNSQENGSIELWIEQTGVEGKVGETLSYLTKDELYQLFKEVKQAGKDLFD